MVFKESSHRFLGELRIDRLLGLIFKTADGGEAVGHHHQRILNILVDDLGLVLGVLVVVPQVLVEGCGKAQPHCPIGTAAVFQPRRVVVILNVADLLGEAEGSGDLQLHFRPVFRIPAPALRFPEHGHGKGIVPHHFLNILADTVLIAEFFRLKLAGYLITELEANAFIHHRLTAQHIPVILRGNVDIRKHLLIRPPVEHRAGLFPVGWFFL